MMQTDQSEQKRIAAEYAANQVKHGMVVGLGTGSTAYFLVEAIGKRVQQGLRITGIPTSEKTAVQARSLNIPLSDLATYPAIDMTIDGADEVARGSLDLVKGLGGALLREKIVASATKTFVIIVDQSKIVDRLGSKCPVPIEVIPFGWQATANRLKGLGANPVLRKTPTGEFFLTDGGHYILDCSFGPIADPRALDHEINSVVGVVEHGLFLRMTAQVVVATTTGIEILTSAE
jgi:ribose 5-phosphate isomerase A